MNTTSPAKRDSKALELPSGAALTRTSLELPPGLDIDEWAACGRDLARVQDGVLWWLGDWWRYGEHAYGERAAAVAEGVTGYSFGACANAGWVAGKIETSRRREDLSYSHHAELAALDPIEQDRWLETAADERLSTRDLRARIRKRAAIDPPAPPAGKYSAIVIDPPWPIEKITREVRPKQGPALDYPVMQLDEIKALPISELASEGTHVYLWTTHKFVPAAFDLFATWGVRYECLLTWIKNVGMTPFSWMYDTEHVLFGRIGQLEVVTKGQRLSFQAPVQGHSVKPDVFYERVVAASPEPRLEMFARTARPGFTAWGNEIAA